MKQPISHQHVDQLAHLARMAGAQGFTDTNEGQESYAEQMPMDEQPSSMTQKLLDQLMTSFRS